MLGDKYGKFGAGLNRLFRTKDIRDDFKWDYQSEQRGKRILNITAKGIVLAAEEIQLVAIEDITQRRGAEKALKDSEKKYQTLVNNIRLGIFRSMPGPKGKFLEVNPAMEQITGYSRQELLQMNVCDLYVKPMERQQVLEDIVSCAGITTREIQFIKKDGTKITVSDTKTPVRNNAGQVIYFDGILEDITPRKTAEEQLRMAEQNFRNSMDNSPLGILIATADEEILYANVDMLDIYGYSSVEELKTTPSEKCYTPETYAEHQERKERRKRGEFIPLDYEVSIVRKDGEIRYLQVSRREVIWNGTTQFQTIYQDITERRRAEESLRYSEERYRTMIESAKDAIISMDSSGRIISWNMGAQRIFGYTEEEVMGKMLTDFLSPPSIPSFTRQLMQLRFMALPHHTGITHEWPAVRKDGSELNGEFAIQIWMKGKETFYTAIMRDITGRKKMQEQLIIADRMVSLGELISGIAHELNNPMTSVLGFSDLLLGREAPEDIKEDLKEINREAKRAVEIIKNLLTFARRHEATKEPLNINKIIENMLELRAYDLKVSNIGVKKHLAPDLPEIMADPFRLQQVFLNIVINAEYFMIEAHRRGTLTIATEQVGNMVRASFADDGPGIDPKNMQHIFIPFFTTKEVGKGTGLGLSICHRIVTEHGGKIWAESESGKGATLTVELPMK